MSTTAFFNFNNYETYADAAALTAVDTTSLANGSYAQVTNLGVFQLNKESTASADGTTVIAGDKAGVNWDVNYFSHLFMSATGEIDGSQIGAVGSISLTNGTVGAPALSWASDPTDGWYRIGSGNEGYAIAGAKIFDISATFVTVTTAQLAVPAGTAAAPSVTFTGDVNCGLYRVGADQVGVSCAGAVVLTVAATAVTVATGAQVLVPASSAAAPAVVIGGEQTGPYLVSAGNLGFSIAGTLKATLSATVFTLVTGIQVNLPGASAAAPAVTLGGEQTGLYLVGAGSLGLSVAGAIKTNLTATALNMASGVALQIATVQVVGARNTGWVTFAGTGTKDQNAINVDTFTATDANIRLLGQGVKGILDALITHGLLGA